MATSFKNNLCDYLDEYKEDLDKPSIIFNKNIIYRKDFLNYIYSFCDYLITIGFQKGDKCILVLGNIPETLYIFWAVLHLGGCISILSDRFGIKQIKSIINELKPKCIFIDDKYKTKIKYNPKITYIFKSKLEDICSKQVINKVTSKVISVDAAVIIYTSGSTGKPKGIVLEHRHMLAAANSINAYLNYKVDDVIMCTLPLSFDYGLYQHILAIKTKATLVLYDRLLWPPQLIKDIDTYNGTILPVVPSLLSLLNNTIKSLHYSGKSLRMITNTGAALSKNHFNYAERLFPKAEFFSMYGLTECKRCTYVPPEQLKNKKESIGIPMPNLEIDIINDNQQFCNPYEEGQLVVRSETIMREYYKKPTLTDKVIKKHPIYGDKCLYTGDYGYKDDDGFLYLKGRKDDMVKVLGFRFSLREPEKILSKNPLVQEIACLSFLEDGDSHIVAFIQTNEEQSSVENKLQKWVIDKLPSYKQPKKYICLTELPKNSNGKINKENLKQWLTNT